MGRWRVRLAGVMLAGSLVATIHAGPLGAATQPTPPSSLPGSPAPAPRIIPQPNSGTKPRDYGDRGGAGQAWVFFGVCGVLVGMGALVVRESRRKLKRAATLAAAQPAGD